MAAQALRALLPLALSLTVGCAGGPPPGEGRRTMQLPGITLHLEEETYTVLGNSVAEIAHSLRRRRPSLDGRGVLGIHSYQIRWEYGWERVPGGCAVRDVEVELTSKVLLPRWTGSRARDPELTDRWDAYLRGIREHEDQHRSLAVQSALQLQRELGAMVGASCDRGFNERVNARGREILDLYVARNQAFDRSSGGARWPPY